MSADRNGAGPAIFDQWEDAHLAKIMGVQIQKKALGLISARPGWAVRFLRSIGAC